MRMCFFVNSDSGLVACRSNSDLPLNDWTDLDGSQWFIMAYYCSWVFAENLTTPRYPMSCHYTTWFSLKTLLLRLARCQRGCLRNSMHRGIEAQVDCIPTIFDVRTLSTLRDRCLGKVRSCRVWNPMWILRDAIVSLPYMKWYEMGLSENRLVIWNYP